MSTLPVDMVELNSNDPLSHMTGLVPLNNLAGLCDAPAHPPHNSHQSPHNHHHPSPTPQSLAASQTLPPPQRLSSSTSTLTPASTTTAEVMDQMNAVGGVDLHSINATAAHTDNQGVVQVLDVDDISVLDAIDAASDNIGEVRVCFYLYIYLYLLCK